MKMFAVALVLLAAGAIVTVILSTENPANAQGGRSRFMLNKYFPLEEGITWNCLQTYSSSGQDFEIFLYRRDCECRSESEVKAE